MKWLVRALGAVFLAAGAQAAQACPDYSQWGQQLSYSASQLYQAHAHQVVAGGPYDLQRCRIRAGNHNGSLSGYVAEAPDFTVQYSGQSGYELEIRVESNCDTVLLINTGNVNWYYSDDRDGSHNPRIRLTRPSNGIYDIWIGTFDAANCNARLIMETF